MQLQLVCSFWWISSCIQERKSYREAGTGLWRALAHSPFVENCSRQILSEDIPGRKQVEKKANNEENHEQINGHARNGHDWGGSEPERNVQPEQERKMIIFQSHWSREKFTSQKLLLERESKWASKLHCWQHFDNENDGLFKVLFKKKHSIILAVCSFGN